MCHPCAEVTAGLLTLDTLCLYRVFYQGKIGPRGPTSSSSVCQEEKEREEGGGKKTKMISDHSTSFTDSDPPTRYTTMASF